ncbi:hypothetical protein [Actinoplanes sp. NPDC026670]|uniref:hypothetical protein n=1 Tax=Actinoplanes sp. NPDC026670 TaxID=3154700 RepID=UPI0033E8A96A
MSNEGSVSLTPKQIIRLLVVGALFVAFMVEIGQQIRARREAAPPFGSAAASGAPANGQRAGSDADARNAAAMAALFGPPQVRSYDPSALMKSAGQPTRLSKGDTEWLVTPSNPATTTAPCAAGTLVTIDLQVETTAGTEALPLDAFLLLTGDGPAAPSVACSTGFGGTAAQRTLAFPATTYDQLIVGPDPATPAAIWHLP